MKDLYEISLGQMADLIEEARNRGSGATDFEELKLLVRDLGIEVCFLVKRLETEFDESSDPDDINACLANHLHTIGREIGRIKELRGDELKF